MTVKRKSQSNTGPEALDAIIEAADPVTADLQKKSTGKAKLASGY